MVKDWEQRQVSDLSKETFGGGTPKTSKKEYWSGDIPWIQSSDLKLNDVKNISINKHITKIGLENSAAKLIPKNSLAIVTRVGVGKVALIPFDYTTSQDFLSLSNLNVNKDFGLFLIYNTLQKELLALQGTSIKGITKKEILKKSLRVPKSLHEQGAIGRTLNNLDKYITLHQRKINIIHKLKSSYHQRIFPDTHSLHPELRFGKYNKPWNKYLLKNVTSHRGGTALEKYFSDHGKYKVISIGSYGLDSNYIDQGIRVESNKVTDSKVVLKDELTMVLNDKTPTGDIIGRSLLIDENNKYVINQRTEIITPYKNLNSQFAYFLLNGPFRKEVRRIVQGGTQIYVNYSSVEKLPVLLPKLGEQQIISDFLRNLDIILNQHQLKINSLERIKKIYLNKMFI